MSFSNINRVVLVGRLTRDPELRTLPSGTALCSLRLACKGMRRDADGSTREKPNFFSVSVFGSQAENVNLYIRKGRRLAIDGRLAWSEWETSDGARRQAVDVVAERVEFLDGPDGHDSGEAVGEGDPGEEPGREPVGVGAGLQDDIVF